MKNLLLGSAVAALALSAFGAQAQNVTFETGGVFTGAVGYVDRDFDSGDVDAELDDDDDEDNNVAIVRDAEVNFVGEIVSDNGLLFGMQVELEAGDRDDGDGDSVIDEAFMYVVGPFGRFELGEADGAADGPMGSGNVEQAFSNAADEGGFLFDYYDTFGIFSNGGDTGDSIKISYFTPSFSGFTAGVSYVPTFQENGVATRVEDGTEVNAFEVGARYSGEFSGVGITAGAGWASDISANRDDDSSIAGGVAASFGGATLGVNYGWRESCGASGADIDFDIDGDRVCEDEDDQHVLGVQGNYNTGPWLFSAAYGQILEGPNEDTFGVNAGVRYALAPGVTTGVTVEYAQDDADGDGADDDDEDREAFAAGVFMGLNF